MKYWRNKCDRLLQEINRKINKRCEVCGKHTTVGHHFFPKSVSSALRYDWDNIIPLCNGCHFKHHNGNPTIHAVVIGKRGLFWYDNLEKKRHKIIKISISYYKKIYDELSSKNT